MARTHRKKTSRKRIDELGSLQLVVMEVLWNRGESSVADVRKALSGEKTPAYTTVLSVLQKLEKAGWVTHRSEGRSYVYAARRTRDEERTSAVRSFIDGVFRGDPRLVLQHLLKDERLTDKDLAALRAMIEAKRRERGDDDDR